MKSGSNLLFEALFVVGLLLLGGQGALMSFWPERWKAIQAKFPRGYNPDSPGGRMMEHYRTGKATLADRLSGLGLLAVAAVILVWFVRRF